MTKGEPQNIHMMYSNMCFKLLSNPVYIDRPWRTDPWRASQTQIESSQDFTGIFPFHADDTASLVVTSAKNLWHGFGCGLGGGTYRLRHHLPHGSGIGARHRHRL